MAIKNNVISGFNRGAKTYNQVAHLQAKIAEKLAARILSQPANQILEIGCGTGLLSQYLVQNFKEANLYLTDIAEAMIEQCRQRFSQQNNINLLCMDGEAIQDLPSFDLIVSSMTMHWFAQLPASIREIKQKLRHGGRFVFALLTAQSLHEWREMCMQCDIPYATPAFPTVDELAATFPEITWHVEAVKEPYQNLQAFLFSLKSLGAIAPRADYQPLSSSMLRKMMQRFDKQIEITYEVVYGEYQCN